jgi:hypothetical protein
MSGRKIVNKFYGIVGAVVASALTASSMAASVNVTGSHSSSLADLSGVLGANTSGFVTFSSGSGNNRVSGRVEYANNLIGNTQRFGLALTQFSFVGNGSTTQSVTVDLVQDFRIAGSNVGTAQAGIAVQGNVVFNRAGQLVQGTIQSTHENINLPLIGFNPNGVLSSNAATSLLSRGTGNPQGVQVIGDIYRIAVQYRFTINAGGGIVSVELPQSLGDVATLVLVPLPPAGWAGLAGLALVGYGSWRRKKLVAQQN